MGRVKRDQVIVQIREVSSPSLPALGEADLIPLTPFSSQEKGELDPWGHPTSPGQGFALATRSSFHQSDVAGQDMSLV